MKYLLVDIGCFECHEDTYVGSIVTEVPKGYKIAKLNSDAGANYSEYRLAIELGA